MAIDMQATRAIGIPAPKPAAKAILGFVLLKDEVCGAVDSLVEAVVEEAVVSLVEIVIEVCETVVLLVEAVVEEAEATEVVVLDIKASPSVAAGVEVLVAPSMVVYVEIEMECSRSSV